MMAKSRFSRVMLVVALGVFLVAGLVTSAAAADFNWKKYEGTTLRFLANKHPWTDAIEPLIPEFEKKTGIKVNLEVFPEDQFRQKVTVELAAGTGSMDVFMSMPVQEGQKFERSGWYEPLDKFVPNKALTNPDFDAKDFLKASFDGERINGKLIGLPIQSETELLFYRKDLFEKYKVKVPTTMDEMLAAARKLTMDTDGDGQVDLYGIVSRGKRAAATSQFSTYLHNFGGEWLDKDRKPAVNTPAAIKAFQYYGNILRNYGPPGSSNNHWYEVTSLFSQGKAAMMTDASVFMSIVEDPEKSKVGGKVGYVVFPKGSAGTHPLVINWGLSISAQSRNKEAAWYFLQWAASKENALKAQLANVPTARKSAWESPEFKAMDKHPDWTVASLKSYQIGTPLQNPPVVAVSEVRDAIGLVIVDAILGKDVKASANKAAQEMGSIMSKTE